MREEPSPQIAIATYEGLPELAEDDRPLLIALHQRGFDALPVVWDEPTIDWRDFALVVVRSPWDYPANLDAFLAWHERVERETQVANRSWTSRASVHKGYLRDLEGRGVPVIPTEIVTDGDQLRAVAIQNGWASIVVKPVTSLGNRSVSLIHDVARADLLPLLARGSYCVQPYLSRVATEGEYSITCIDGTPSHVVIKRPISGEFRIHEKFGGTHAPFPLTDELRAFGQQMLSATKMDREMVARFDVIRDDTGVLRLVEMDLFGPCLYFCHCPPAVEHLADAIAAKANQT